ncbi:hypothetical protein HDR63_02340 [bacterium]|nr:hypothetical protein [bacterium]
MVQLDSSLWANVAPKVLGFVAGVVLVGFGAVTIWTPRIKKANDKLNQDLVRRERERQK